MIRVAAIVGLLSYSGVFAAERPFTEWTPTDFESQGKVVVGPEGDAQQRFELKQWKEPTLVDLRESKFSANEDGPFNAENLPKEWPTGEAFQQLAECSQNEKYPLSFKGGPAGICVLGGSVVGVQPRELPWRFMKKSYDGDALHIESGGRMIADGLYSENVEDHFSPRGGGYWTIRHSYSTYCRDDFVENDGLLSGEIIDCLVDGCHVLLSNRPGRKAKEAAVAKKKDNPPHVKIRDTLVHVSKMPYDGDMKYTDRERIVDGMCGGRLFKWSEAAGTVDCENCLFRLDMMSPTGPTSMRFPEGTYRSTTLIWLGEGDYPSPVPEGVTVSRDAAIWDKAREAWLAKHPNFANRN